AGVARRRRERAAPGDDDVRVQGRADGLAPGVGGHSLPDRHRARRVGVPRRGDRVPTIPTGPPAADMSPNLIVEVLWGPEQGRKAVVPAGGQVSVGRGEAAGLRLAHDEALAPVHFELAWDG